MENREEPWAALTDGVVTLRRFLPEDADAVFEACQDREISRWTAAVPWPYPLEAAMSWIESHDSLWHGGLGAPFAVADAIDNRLLGSMSIHVKPDAHHAIAGYWIAAPERTRGVATRALQLALVWTKRHGEVPEVVLRTQIGNIASERVAQNNGFAFVREETDYVPTTVNDRTFHVRLWSRDLGSVSDLAS